MINQIWPWFEIRYLKSLLRDLTDDFRTLETDYINLQDAHRTLNDRYQDMKTDEIVGELRRKVLEDKLAAINSGFAKFDADGDCGYFLDEDGVMTPLLRKEVPKPPKRLRNGVLDVGLNRWRFTNGRLVTYIEYLPKELWKPNFAPWAKFWSAT